jgi:hypothetical protein
VPPEADFAPDRPVGCMRGLDGSCRSSVVVNRGPHVAATADLIIRRDLVYSAVMSVDIDQPLAVSLAEATPSPDQYAVPNPWMVERSKAPPCAFKYIWPN